MKKEQILESARALFTQYGYRKVSMNEIAASANVTKKMQNLLLKLQMNQ